MCRLPLKRIISRSFSVFVRLAVKRKVRSCVGPQSGPHSDCGARGGDGRLGGVSATNTVWAALRPTQDCTFRFTSTPTTSTEKPMEFMFLVGIRYIRGLKERLQQQLCHISFVPFSDPASFAEIDQTRRLPFGALAWAAVDRQNLEVRRRDQDELAQLTCIVQIIVHGQNRTEEGFIRATAGPPKAPREEARKRRFTRKSLELRGAEGAAQLQRLLCETSLTRLFPQRLRRRGRPHETLLRPSLLRPTFIWTMTCAEEGRWSRSPNTPEQA